MHEKLVGLLVSNEELYQEYRNAMLPILKEYGGGFGYDFNVSEVLINYSSNPINRVFTIHFPDKDSSKEFFNNHKYQEAKERYYNAAVECTTIISEYDK
jgi:uncharacterized protein (DUF1330 family)